MFCDLIGLSETWIRRRRGGRRRCTPQDCVLNNWAPFGSCSKTCGGGLWFKEGLFELEQGVVVKSVLIITVLNDIGLFLVIRNAVLLTAGGLGAPGVHVRVVKCHSKPERCVL